MNKAEDLHSIYVALRKDLYPDADPRSNLSMYIRLSIDYIHANFPLDTPGGWAYLILSDWYSKNASMYPLSLEYLRQAFTKYPGIKIGELKEAIYD